MFPSIVDLFKEALGGAYIKCRREEISRYTSTDELLLRLDVPLPRFRTLFGSPPKVGIHGYFTVVDRNNLRYPEGSTGSPPVTWNVSLRYLGRVSGTRS